MSTGTITGNLAVDLEAVQAGRVQIVKLRVIENTGGYRAGEWTPHEAPTAHSVEAKFELGDHVLASLHKGDAVIVVGYERTVAWGEGDDRRTGRVLEADAIGPNLTRATVVVTPSRGTHHGESRHPPPSDGGADTERSAARRKATRAGG